MKLKGAYSSGTTYAVGDVVFFEEDGNVYHLQKLCAAGTKPIDTRYWGKSDPATTEIVQIAMDAIDIANGDDAQLEDDLNQTTAGKKALDAHQGYVLKGMIPTNINDEAITLSTATGEYLITVDDSGETPELAVTLIEEEAET